ncbi:peptidoglycan-binding domain-containing protein [Enhydrobacter sp.]|uniref:peptidoglycan-binding domain-containing protein n=1 Tax=Enhydrobacter sp. TaxID=1894999 RepID=UPI0026067688|nr:peptidoglycan-binding domain-containing protein [Enhydrobacter sp.]
MPRPDGPSPAVERDRDKKPARRASGAGAVTGLLGIVCALLGVLSAPSLFLPLAVAFSAFALLRSLAVLSVAGTIAATLSCVFTVVGLVLFPWETEDGGRAAAASSAVPAVNAPQGAPVLPAPPAAAPSATTGMLSMPPVEAPSPPPAAAKPETAPPAKPPAAAGPEAAPPAKPPDEAKPGPAPAPAPASSSSSSSSATPSESPPAPRLENALPEPPPPAAAVVPDRPATPPETEQPNEQPQTAKAVAPPPWPESRTEQTKAIQILLRDLDFYHGTTNGTFGPATRAAICLYLVTYDEKGECEPTKALYESLLKRRANANVGTMPR